MRNSLIYLAAFVSALIAASCSSEKNTWTSKAYHNTTAHFNGYFYANEEIKKIESVIAQNQVDDYNRILRLYPTFDTALAKGYDKEVQEAVKMASIAIQRHPNSKWVDDAYILVGKARHYSLDWGNAIQTFKHVNTKSKDKDARHLAIINLIRTYIEHKEFNNAKAAIDFLEKGRLSRTNRKKFNLEKAYYYQMNDDLDNMVRSLTAADPLLKRTDSRGRIYFIIGQVYQKLGFESEAYNYYKKCIGTNPAYEVDFYARLYMAQVTEISRSRDITAARKSFKKLLTDAKNREFVDKIYYEMGVFEFKQKNIKEAIENYNLSIRRGTSKKIDGEAYLRLGEIYYDTLRDYELSAAYYDSAIQSLPADYENYTAIKTRQEILSEFVTHLKTIEWQDSLMKLSTLDSMSIRAAVDSTVTRKLKAEKARSSKKKNRERIEINSNESLVFDDNPNSQGQTTDWYFGNPSAMALGRTEFISKWGNIKLEDNWRRSQRQVSSVQQAVAQNRDTLSATGGQNTSAGTAPDPVETEFAKLYSQIPRTDDARKESLAKVEEAYVRLADIYHFKLQEIEYAAETYKTLLIRFPQTKHEPEVLYALYIIYKDIDAAQANRYAESLKQKYPNTTVAKILANPDYLQESSLAVERQKGFYKTAYDWYEKDSLQLAEASLRQALSLGETSFTPTLNLLGILIKGKTEDITRYQYELEQFVKIYESEPIAAYATRLLNASREFQKSEEKRRGIQFIRSFEEPHYFVLIYKRSIKMDAIATSELEKFNETYFKQLGLQTSNLVFNDEYALTFVADLQGLKSAKEYYQRFIEKLPTIAALQNQKFDNFVITKDNFDIFYRTKGLDEYIQFFEKNY